MGISYFNSDKSLALQLYDLKSKYECINYEIKRSKLVWRQKVKPTIYSREYIITVIYNGIKPDVYLFNQKILKGKDDPVPHCYSRSFKSPANEHVRLCLYYPKYKEWTRSMYLSETIIPWAIEWLKYYEIWRVTGNWLGGGIEHEKN